MQRIRMSQLELASILFAHGVATIALPNGKVGILQSVLRESGSGNSFILQVNTDNGPEKVLCATS